MSVELTNAEAYLEWLGTKSHMNAIAPSARRRFVKRGQVYWCHFGLNVGSEMSKSTPRPAVVVQNFAGNKYSGNTIVAPVTHNDNDLPCQVPLAPVHDEEGKVILDGQVNTASLLCVSKARLGDLITTLTTSQMRQVDRSIAISLDLLHYYDGEAGKYQRLLKHVEQVKRDRNEAQDLLQAVRSLLEAQGEEKDCIKNLKKLLDMD